MTVAYRPAELADAPFVVSAWSRAFKPSRSAGMIATEDWERTMHPQIQRILARPDTRTIVQFENTSPASLYGFIAGDLAGYTVEDKRGELVFDPTPVVFFCYVKEAYRRAGYARGLFAALGVDPGSRFVFTCMTPVVRRIGVPLAAHDPNRARYPKRPKEH